MAGYPFLLTCRVSVVLALVSVQAGRAQDIPPPLFTGPLSQFCETALFKGAVCKVYSLAELGDDANMCKWVAETIPQMIQPGSWNGADGKSKLSYYAPGKVMVIHQTAAVHAQVDDFLKSLKATQAKVVRRDPQVLPAQFAQAVPPVGPAYPGYPMAQPPPAPKHLLHFILGVGVRYEGEGIVDANVVKLAKILGGQPTVTGAPTANDPMFRPEIQMTDVQKLKWQPSYAPSNAIPGSVGSASGSLDQPNSVIPAAAPVAPSKSNVPPMPPANAPLPSTTAQRNLPPQTVLPVPPAPPLPR